MVAAAAKRHDVFRAVADQTRRRMLDLLHKRERSVGELLDEFEMTQPAVSKHLRILRQARLVEARVDGRRRLYRLRSEPIQDIFDWSARYVVDPAGHAWGIRPAQARGSEQT